MTGPDAAAATVLVVDDEAPMRHVLREVMEGDGHAVVEAETAHGAVERAVREPPDVVVLDIRLPDGSGLDALDRIRAVRPDLPVIMITGDGSRELGLEAVRKGAYDFFTKPFDNAELSIVVERALEMRRLRREVQELRRARVEGARYGPLVGQTAAMRRVFQAIERVASTDLPVLIQGESGTGKELVAEAIHDRSGRAEEPLVKVNCIAIPEGLIESELFGHEKGAFTGATERKPGKFEQADGGTLFLDEIGDLPPDLQGKLLRVLQEQSFERVGGTETLETDVRIVAATNRDLDAEVEAGRFREDLFYRLNVFPVELPPLRERRGDVPYLVHALLDRVRERHDLEVEGVSAEAIAALASHDWPGNVRELENSLRSAAVRAEGGTIRLRDLPETLAGEGEAAADAEAGPAADAGDEGDEESLDQTLAAVEEAMIRRALAGCEGVQARAAEELGVSERSLWYRVKKYGIDPEEYRPEGEETGPGGDGEPAGGEEG